MSRMTMVCIGNKFILNCDYFWERSGTNYSCPGADVSTEVESEGSAFQLDQAKIDGLLSVLAERVRDVNAFTRTTTLRTWALLCEYVTVAVTNQTRDF